MGDVQFVIVASSHYWHYKKYSLVIVLSRRF